MAEFTGKNIYVEFSGTAISGNQRNFTDDQVMDLVDASAGADVARTYLTTLEDGTAALEVLYEEDGTAATYVYQVCDKGAFGTLIFGVEGTTSGKPKTSVPAYVSNRNREFPYDDVVVLNIEFQYSGETTDGTWA